jgi:hypothetical protein
VSVAPQQLLRQRRPQPLAAEEASVVHPLQESQPEVVWADRLRRHLRLARPQLVVAVETVATARQVLVESAAMVAQL